MLDIKVLICLVLACVGTVVLGTTMTSSSNSAQSSKPVVSSSSLPSSTHKSTFNTHRVITTGKHSTPSPAKSCELRNSSCDECVKDSKCLYCYTDNTCRLYPIGKVLPTSVCSLSKARWGVCWVNFEALIIAVSVIGGVIILTITCCCIYCCCCRGKNKKYEREDSKYEQQKMERKNKQDERKSDRKGRLDEIRRKYGLVKEDAPYQRFDA